jgi:hypothetical protein
MKTSVLECLAHPVSVLTQLEGRNLNWSKKTLQTWAILVVIIVGASAVYGASLSLNCAWQASSGALWLILSAGVSWCIFGPALLFVTRKNMFVLAHACLITMFFGEVTLLFTALTNVILWKLRPALTLDYVAINSFCVGISNLVMAVALCLQLRGIGVDIWKCLLLWIFVLDGCGSLLFYFFYQVLNR